MPGGLLPRHRPQRPVTGPGRPPGGVLADVAGREQVRRDDRRFGVVGLEQRGGGSMEVGHLGRGGVGERGVAEQLVHERPHAGARGALDRVS